MVKAHNKWKESGFEVLAFPCNQFFSQESGSPEEITAFVKENFNANFPIMEKIEVNGPDTHPLYAYLRSNSSLYDPKTKEAKLIPWNFAKFFINSEGKVVQFFSPQVKVEEVLSYIEQTLKK
jgi:glutathione peroxidase